MDLNLAAQPLKRIGGAPDVRGGMVLAELEFQFDAFDDEAESHDAAIVPQMVRSLGARA